jgi:hypothetical protein
MIGPFGNLHLGSPERGDVLRRGNTAKRIGTQIPQRLWKHSDCYNLQKVQMRVMGMVEVALLGTRRHRDKTLQPIQLLPILLWFPWRWWSAWIRQSRGRSSHFGDESEVLLRRSMFPEEDTVVCLLITQKSKSNKKKFVLSYPTG